MRIALTYNEKRGDGEEEAEFDSLDTIHAIARLLASLGHVVRPVEVSGPVERVVAQLRLIGPELVFNLAEGNRGRFREAFYPALFEHLELPHTGSSASVLALCLDKALAKRVVATASVATPRAQLVRDRRELEPFAETVIVKPNFEGSSKGITQASVVSAITAQRDRVGELLARYPEGVLVEQYVDGTDVSVGWVDGLGVLAPIGYAYEPSGPHAIYDLALKQGPPERVHVQVPAPLPVATTTALLEAAMRAFVALGVTGYGRADFRVTGTGDVQFLEMNPLPSLAPRDRDLYAAAAPLGKSPRDLLAHIIGGVSHNFYNRTSDMSR